MKRLLAWLLRRRDDHSLDCTGPATVYGHGGGSTGGRRIWDDQASHGERRNSGRWSA